jgi:hypothetical protein
MVREGNNELFIFRKEQGNWKIHRYLFALLESARCQVIAPHRQSGMGVGRLAPSLFSLVEKRPAGRPIPLSKKKIEWGAGRPGIQTGVERLAWIF